MKKFKKKFKFKGGRNSDRFITDYYFEETTKLARELREEYRRASESKNEAMHALYRPCYELYYKAVANGEAAKLRATIGHYCGVKLASNTSPSTAIVKAFLIEKQKWKKSRDLICRYSNVLRCMQEDDVKPEDALEQLKDNGGFAGWSIRYAKRKREVKPLEAAADEARAVQPLPRRDKIRSNITGSPEKRENASKAGEEATSQRIIKLDDKVLDDPPSKAQSGIFLGERLPEGGVRITDWLSVRKATRVWKPLKEFMKTFEVPKKNDDNTSW